MKTKNSKIHTNKGITLIALIITVIIMLILAAVIIDLIVDGKLFNSAENAVGKTNDKVKQQENDVWSIVDEWDKLNEPDPEPDPEPVSTFKLVARGEEAITVKVEGTNLQDYQFSLDGENWTDIQQSNEYTFTGLTKVVVDSTNYKTQTGTPYTVYAKAKTDENETKEYTPIETSTIVEVSSSADYFNYTDLGDEILITGFKEDAFYNKEIQQAIIEPILIPSYINGKPVTKISTNLIMENISKPVSAEYAVVDAYSVGKTYFYHTHYIMSESRGI